VGPATPDHTIYTKRLPAFVSTESDPAKLATDVEAGVARFVEDYTRYFEAHAFDGAELTDPWPRVVLVPGLGMFTAGKDRRKPLESASKDLGLALSLIGEITGHAGKLEVLDQDGRPMGYRGGYDHFRAT